MRVRASLDDSAPAKQETDDEQHEENKEQDLRNTDRGSRYAAKSKKGSENRNNQENPSVPKHLVVPPLLICARTLPDNLSIYFLQLTYGLMLRAW